MWRTRHSMSDDGLQVGSGRSAPLNVDVFLGVSIGVESRRSKTGISHEDKRENGRYIAAELPARLRRSTVRWSERAQILLHCPFRFWAAFSHQATREGSLLLIADQFFHVLFYDAGARDVQSFAEPLGIRGDFQVVFPSSGCLGSGFVAANEVETPLEPDLCVW